MQKLLSNVQEHLDCLTGEGWVETMEALNIFHCAGQAEQQRLIRLGMSVVLRLRKLELENICMITFIAVFQLFPKFVRLYFSGSKINNTAFAIGVKVQTPSSVTSLYTYISG